jgi:hypothetical protein
MENETYYFYKHYKLYKIILNDIMIFSFNDYRKDCEIYSEEKLYENYDDCEIYSEEKLYGNYDDWEDYWDSIYG